MSAIYKLVSTIRMLDIFEMSIAAEKVAEALALPERDRAFLARELLASLDPAFDPDAEMHWNELIDQRSREMAQGRIDARSENEVVGSIREKLRARQAS